MQHLIVLPGVTFPQLSRVEINAGPDTTGIGALTTNGLETYGYRDRRFAAMFSA